MKKISVVILCLVLAISFCACGAKSGDMDFAPQENATVMNDSITLYSATADTAAGTDLKVTETPASQDEKIIKTVTVHIETKEYNACINGITASVNSFGGYVEKSYTQGEDSRDYNRNATIIVRIPSAKLDEFLLTAGENGKITDKTEEQQNVTLEYVDLESRISAFKTERETLTKLLSEAASLENVLAIQERLSEVNYEIENYTAKLRVLENRVSYSTVTMEIREVERVTESEPSLWTEIKDRFLDNLDELGDTLRYLVVEILGGIPVILPLAAIAVVAIIIIKKIWKKHKAKKNKAE